MTDLTKNPDLRSREKIDDYFGDWKWREGLAELMVPIVGRLYRHGIHIMIYGQSLVNKSPIDIMHAHRFVRQIEENELSEFCLLYTSPSPRDQRGSRMPSSA